MVKYLVGLSVCMCAGILSQAMPALAQQVAGDGQVVIPWGDWLAASAGTLLTVSGSVLVLALSLLPKTALAMLKTWQVDQLLERAIGYGINMAVGAAKGQALTLPVANKVAESALEYVITNGSAALIAWMGGKDVIAQKIVARLDLAPDVVVSPAVVASK